MRRLLPLLLLAACVDPAADPEVGPDAGAPQVGETPGVLALSRQVPARRHALPPADFDGDGAVDLVRVLHKGGRDQAWLIDYSGNGFGALDLRVQSNYGAVDDQAVPANYGGDARADIAYYRRTPDMIFWDFDLASDGPTNGFGVYEHEVAQPVTTFGDPVPADYNHDTHIDLAVLGEDGTWRIDFYEEADDDGVNLGFAGFELEILGYGTGHAYPVAADFDGDTWIDVAVRQDDGTWRIDLADQSQPSSPFHGFDLELHDFGTTAPGTVASAADFDGDLKADLAWRNQNGIWFFDLSRNGSGSWDLTSWGWGGVDTQPLPADYNNDGLADLAAKDDCGGWRIDYTTLDATMRPVWAGIDATASWAQSSDYVFVTNQFQLLSALGRDFVGTIEVWGASIDLGANRELSMPPCARLTSNRNLLTPGGMLFTNDLTEGPLFLVTGDHVRIDHVRLRGPGADALASGVKVQSARDFRIDHVEASWFPGAAVSIDDSLGRITRSSGIAHVEDSYFHNNQKHDKGYGVAVGRGAWAQIERNTFNWNRHGITSDGEPESGYFAYRNLFLEGVHLDGFDALAHVDIHGTGQGVSGHGGIAGEYFDIGWNYVRGNALVELEHVGSIARPAVNVRGRPTDRVDVHDNVFQHTDGALRTCWWNGSYDPIDFLDCTYDVYQWNNKLGRDSTANIAVGDFDADGRADVFMGTGISWWYSSGGQTEWRFLRETVEVASELYFANVDSDPRTDVIYHKSDGVLVYSSGGTGPWTTLTTTPTPLPKLHFADFDGDGKTDIFRTTGSQWWIWHGNVRAWFPHVESSLSFANMRFGEFDDVAGTDVLAHLGGAWKVNRSGSAGGWQTWFTTSTSLAGTIVADIDGNGRADLVKNGPFGTNTWVWSKDAKGPFVQRRGASSTYRDVAEFRFGNFDGNPQRHALRTQPFAPYRFVISRNAAEIPHDLSGIDMR